MLRRLSTCLCLALLGALLTHRLAQAQPLVTIRNPSSNYYQDGFGRALAELGGKLLVGTSNQGNGDAYLYDPLTGALLQTFLNPGMGSFGTSIASVGGNALVGSSPSAAFLFDGTTGALLRTFPSPVGTEARFGLSVAALGSNVLVGAPGGFCCDADPGAVYLFDGATGALLRTFQAPTPTNNDAFGRSVTAVGSNVLIGAPGLGLGPGAAYLFDGTTGALLRTFLDPSAPPGDPLFGYSVATAGGNVLVGDPRNDTGETDAGAAHLFDAATGTLLRTFTSPTPSLSAEFGASIATHGGHVLIAPNFGLTAVVFDMGTGAVARMLRSPFTGAMSAVQVAFADGQPAVGTQFQGPVYVYCGGAVGCGPCETCGPAGTCVVAPALTCQPRVDGRMPLRIVNSSTNDARDQVRWSAVGDFEQLPGQENEVLGLPGSDVVNDDYTLCLYDASGAPPNLLFRATAPAAGTCGNDSCWTLSPNCSEQGCGYRYRDSERTPEGVRTIVAKNRDNLKFVATGVNLSDRPGGLPTLPLPLPLRVQLQIREGLCWEADYSAAKANTPMQFRAKAD